jgi:hypothetical protein
MGVNLQLLFIFMITVICPSLFVGFDHSIYLHLSSLDHPQNKGDSPQLGLHLQLYVLERSFVYLYLTVSC